MIPKLLKPEPELTVDILCPKCGSPLLHPRSDDCETLHYSCGTIYAAGMCDSQSPECLGVAQEAKQPDPRDTLIRELVGACEAAQKLFEQGCVDRGWEDKHNWIDATGEQIDAVLAKAREVMG